MNKPSVINFCTSEELTILTPERYQYTPKLGWAWLQRIAIYILKKIGCESTEKIYKSHVVEPKKILDYILDQKKELLKLYHHKGSRLLIGTKQYEEIMKINDDTHGQLFSFDCQYYSGGPKIFNLKVTVVPWMDGVLVIPDLV